MIPVVPIAVNLPLETGLQISISIRRLLNLVLSEPMSLCCSERHSALVKCVLLLCVGIFWIFGRYSLTCETLTLVGSSHGSASIDTFYQKKKVRLRRSQFLFTIPMICLFQFLRSGACWVSRFLRKRRDHFRAASAFNVGLLFHSTLLCSRKHLDDISSLSLVARISKSNALRCEVRSQSSSASCTQLVFHSLTLWDDTVSFLGVSP